MINFRSKDKTLRCWDVDEPTSTALWAYSAHDSSILCIHQLSDGTMITGSEDAIKLWS